MIQKDYFLRMIEELTAVLAHLMGLSDKSSWEEAIQYLDKTYDSFFQFEGKLLRFTPQENLMQVLLEQENLVPEQLEVLAELLRQEAEIWLKSHKGDQAIDCLKKSIHILEYLEEEQKHLYSMERKAKLNDWLHRLQELIQSRKE